MSWWQPITAEKTQELASDIYLPQLMIDFPSFLLLFFLSVVVFAKKNLPKEKKKEGKKKKKKKKKKEIKPNNYRIVPKDTDYAEFFYK